MFKILPHQLAHRSLDEFSAVLGSFPHPYHGGNPLSSARFPHSSGPQGSGPGDTPPTAAGARCSHLPSCLGHKTKGRGGAGWRRHRQLRGTVKTSARGVPGATVSDNRWFPVTGCWTARSHHLPGERSLSIMRMTQRPPGGLLL